MDSDKEKAVEICFEKFKHIEEEFFEIDKKDRSAKIKLSFDKVSDVFDVNYVTHIPVLSDDFMDWIGSTFQLIPSRYKIHLTINFRDYEGYTEKQLTDIFWKNILLDAKSKIGNQKKRNSIAAGLIAIGVAFFISMLLIETQWHTESIMKTIFSYISDIATTVTFWEAMTILIVERREQRSNSNAIRKRFSSITFETDADTNHDQNFPSA